MIAVVEGRGSWLYRAAMLRKLMSLLACLALLLMPLGMANNGHAAAMPAAAAAADHGHCDEDRKAPETQPSQSVGCLAGCAALPAFYWIERHPEASVKADPPARAASLQGVDPEAATPPPRPPAKA